MADGHPDNDCDSTFGEDIIFWTDPMFNLSDPQAGTKRGADNVSENLKTTVSGPTVEEHRAEHIDPRALCCCTCPEEPDCYATADLRPSKRRASVQKVSEFHNAQSGHVDSNPNSTSDQQFLDACFDKFCQGCDFDTTCTNSCALPCNGDTECSKDDACCDPHCDQAPCFEECVDPECTKASCPNGPCFCQKCDAQPCPLGEPGNECHLAHSAPTLSGTIYCYDNAPCHFQDDRFSHPKLPAYNAFPRFSQSHGPSGDYNVTTQGSNTGTPVLSPSNYTSLDSFSNQSSPVPGPGSALNCFLNIPFDHCHIDQACCHGPVRACEECPTAPQSHYETWNPTLAQSNEFLKGSSYPMPPFGAQQNQPTSTLPFHVLSSTTAVTLSSVAMSNIMGFDNSWMLPDSHFSTSFPALAEHGNKLGFLASAIQIPKNEPSENDSGVNAPVFTGTPDDSTVKACICKWQHAPNSICFQIFDTPEALHKHIKTSHVDNCTRCFCQWESCQTCDKDFKQRSKLSRHLLLHAGYKPYACSFEGCNKTFATSQAKDNHERTHTGDKPYVCDTCGYTTTTHTQLQTHISALHLNQKPHKCRFCTFTCADSSNLSKHERTHQTLRPYRCPHPSCTFKPDCRWENLKRHFRRSGHCPELLVEGSEEGKNYRENVRREIEAWNKRHADGSEVGRRRGRGRGRAKSE
ncbi:hypothetical protein K469DRAFT_747803 [Zopfia rhizophila CBS 207.26]|uniref:C2H2-type domain-containing protein n=1 Tax=Zopfia rhizophila CBS 207.26 TaxID=1314779 RepID=A0A6A6EGX1_9PEZI|nr:hypothetical protein K469DRAFT_747803 [Zopfia rhizophila CBS 207.26]